MRQAMMPLNDPRHPNFTLCSCYTCQMCHCSKILEFHVRKELTKKTNKYKKHTQ